MNGGPLVILGVGNVLLSDEGVGVHVVRQLRDEGEAAADVVDGGTLGLELLPVVADASALILVDAAELAAAPGTVAVFRGDDLHARFAGHISPHQAGAGDLVAVARLTGTLPPQVAFVGIQPGSLEPGIDLTNAVRASMPVILATVRWLAAEMIKENGHA